MPLPAGGPNDDDLHLYEHNGRKRIPSICAVLIVTALQWKKEWFWQKQKKLRKYLMSIV
jgi:hypothetical protein